MKINTVKKSILVRFFIGFIGIIYSSYGFCFSLFSPDIKSSIIFYNLSKNKIIYEKNSDISLIPASLQKLITTATVLDTWGPTKTFSTNIYYQGQFNPTSGIINGDLIIAGGGDPYITSEKMFAICHDLVAMGIKKIEGNILIDNSLFDDDIFSSGRKSINYSQRSYDAPITAFAVNFNTLSLSIYPGPTVGSSPLVKMYPLILNNVVIKNKVKTVSGDRSKLTLERTSLSHGNILEISGTIGVNSKLKKKYCSISDPVMIAQEYSKAFLKNAGIEIVERKSTKTYPQEEKHLLLEYKGDPIFKLITSINQYSNNFMADTISKSLGTLKKDKNISLKDGLSVIEDFLKTKVKMEKEFKIEDGSGLSTGNRLSSKQVLDLLIYMYGRDDIFQEYLLSLAIPQENGSLKKRSYLRKIRAKTGTLTSPVAVANIAGYMWNTSGDIIAFAIINNAKKLSSIVDIRDKQDELINSILSSSN